MIALDPHIKVFRDSNIKSGLGIIHAVRGEIAAAQVSIRVDKKSRLVIENPVLFTNGKASFKAIARWIGFVDVRYNTPDTPEKFLERKAPASFPDPILETNWVDAIPSQQNPIWVSIPVPYDQETGVYHGSVKVISDNKSMECNIEVIVHKARLSEKRNLWVTNWLFADKLASQFGTELWSERHWGLIDVVARDMAAHRQNVILTPLFDLLTFYKHEGKIKIDFGKFDRWVELFDKHGAADLIEGVHLGGREGNVWNAEHFTLTSVTIRNQDGTINERIENARVGSKPFCDFLNQFLPILRDYLAKRGWLSRYIQHIADEPIKINAENWVAFSEYVKKLMPEVRRVDAAMTPDVKGAIDIWVPLLNYFDKEQGFYADRQDAGGEIWFYTCLYPRGEYPNRFIDFPLLKTRLLHWINFRYNLPGYLHWGYNWWSENPFSNVEPFQSDGSRLPPGDNAIVYPGKNGILSSMRWEMLRKGVEDYELLLHLKEIRPASAIKKAYMAALNPTICVNNIDAFNAVRLKYNRRT